METKPEVQQFILLPARGLRTASLNSSFAREYLFQNVNTLDSLGENGAKLVELTPEALHTLCCYQSELRLVPLTYYRLPVVPQLAAQSQHKLATLHAPDEIKVRLKIVSKKDGRPIAGAKIEAFTDLDIFIQPEGATDSQGEIILSLDAGSKVLQRLYIYPEKGFWSAIKENRPVNKNMVCELTPVDLPYTDALRHFYGNSPDNAGEAVRVGVVDTGIDTTHPDLRVEGGKNTVPGENPNDYSDNGKGHGTHVAGIIAARGTSPTGLRGIAPAVILKSYRVFGKNNELFRNFDLLKAIEQAVSDGCDLINISLHIDDAILYAIEDAYAKGSLVIVAAGNNYRQTVGFPAAEASIIFVSAMGRIGTFPDDSAEIRNMASPFGTDKNNFVAAFSNIGPGIKLIGPGVDILSTVPGGGYAPMSGTSMACPAVTGAAARLLSTRPDILNMSRDRARSDAMVQALLQSARSLGFGPNYEGTGLPSF